MREGPLGQPGNIRKWIKSNNQMQCMHEGPWGQPGNGSRQCIWPKEKERKQKVFFMYEYLNINSTLPHFIPIIASLILLRICAEPLTFYCPFHRTNIPPQIRSKITTVITNKSTHSAIRQFELWSTAVDKMQTEYGIQHLCQIMIWLWPSDSSFFTNDGFVWFAVVNLSLEHA